MSLVCWLASSLERVFPTSAAGRPTWSDVVARNGATSLQACARNPGPAPAIVGVRVDAPDDVAVRVRRVGCVPLPHHTAATPADELDAVDRLPGLVPDPLFDEAEAWCGPCETVAFWVSVRVDAAAAPGRRTLALTLTADGVPVATLAARLEVSAVVLAPRRDLPVAHWLAPDALCDRYGTAPWSERLWELVARCMADLVAHGSDCQFVPLLTPATDGVRRPAQLLRVRADGPARWTFDFADVARWVRAARTAGATRFEWSHLCAQWGAHHAARVYASNADPASLLWPPDTPATAPVARAFLAQLLPAWRAFLEAESLLDVSIFHLSDEPPAADADDYRAVRALVATLAPWMRIADAVADAAAAALVDLPIARVDVARELAAQGRGAWVYLCCEPKGRWLGRFLDTPLAKLRMAGWLFHRFRARGVLHWGYNHWYRCLTAEPLDPFVETAGGAWPFWAAGDPFVVYPGPDGPLSSIRWEVWAESLEDAALLQTAGVAPDDPLLAPLAGYDAFPREAGWIAAARRRLLL